jgi:aminopeptidase YwaD
MPKNFPFYQPEEHLKIISLLEEGRPAAVIAATSRNPMAGGVYPAPMFEDGDFDVPSVCVTEEEGRRLLKYAGQPATLTFEARRLSSRGCNVIARRGEACSSRVVFCAHIDTKFGTPGALDNAAGVATLLGLAEVLSDYSGKLGLEIVALNGEEYYAAAGEVQYLNRSAGNLQEVLLGVNLDGVGHRDGKTAYSRYDCPDQLSAVIQESLAGGEYVEGDPWYQGDHMLFVQSQRPALALISANWPDFLPQVHHTDADRPELVDCSKLAEVARGLGDLFRRLEREASPVG